MKHKVVAPAYETGVSFVWSGVCLHKTGASFKGFEE